MAALPLQFPDLVLYLADETNTPIISSAGLGLYSGADDAEGADSSQARTLDRGQTNHDPDPGHDHPTNGTPIRPSRHQRAAALNALTTTALRARDAAARLGLGLDGTGLNHTPGLPESGPDTTSGIVPDDASAAAFTPTNWGLTPPEHVVVTYNTGAVMIESFLDPLRQNPTPLQPALRSVGTASPYMSGSGGPDLYTADDEDAGSRGPLLVALVIAPGESSLRDARRATARLERVGHAVQQDWEGS